jgi:hypothetical protein
MHGKSKPENNRAYGGERFSLACIVQPQINGAMEEEVAMRYHSTFSSGFKVQLEQAGTIQTLKVLFESTPILVGNHLEVKQEQRLKKLHFLGKIVQ